MTQRLLILDDDAAVSATIRAMAERFGFEVYAANSAAQFFQLYHFVGPSHCLIDLVLPEIDGMQVIDELAVAGCRAEIILTSGADGRVLDSAQRAAREYGLVVAGVLPKPFSFPSLKNLLGSSSNRHDSETLKSGVDTEDQFAELLKDDLIEAIAHGHLKPAYQPIIRCSDSQLVGFEALARWTRPFHGAVPPAQFIPLAEANGLIDSITNIIAESAIKFISEHSNTPQLNIAINLSGLSLSDADLPDRLLRFCTFYDVQPHRVILEVTETSTFADPLATLTQATRLRLKGFELSIDDFGVGYSSMVQLARLPFSELKIDKSFVQTLCSSQENRKIVKALIGLGHSLGLRLTAEGVEDFDTLKLLNSMRCDYAQGYAIGRPMDHSKTISYLNKNSVSGNND